MLGSTATGLLAAAVAGGGQAPPALADGSLDPHGLLLVHAEGRRVLEAARRNVNDRRGVGRFGSTKAVLVFVLASFTNLWLVRGVCGMLACLVLNVS